MYLKAAIILLSSVSCVNAQVDQVRAAAAVPYLSQQRNFALDSLAVCAGDLQAAQKKIEDLEAKLKEKNGPENPNR